MSIPHAPDVKMRSPLRPLGKFLGVLAVALLVAAVASYPAWLLVGLVSDQPIHRVLHRLVMLAVFCVLLLCAQRLELANRQALGFAGERAAFLQRLRLGFCAGCLAILPLIALLYALGVRVPMADAHQHAAVWLSAAQMKLVANGLASGLVIGLIEEVFFRGAMFTAMQRESGTLAAIAVPSLLYAALHFVGGRLDVPANQIGWTSGFAVVLAMFDKLAHPAAIVDSFVALAAAGALLAWVRARTGNIATSIGLHAAWVCTIAWVRGTTRPDTTHAAGWLVGSYDGVMGWGSACYVVAMAVAFLVWRRLERRPLGQREEVME